MPIQSPQDGGIWHAILIALNRYVNKYLLFSLAN